MDSYFLALDKKWTEAAQAKSFGGCAEMSAKPLSAEASETAQEIGYAARLLVQATLPHSKPKPGINEFERSNGAVIVKVIADSAYGLPYGTYPRLILAWLTTEAVRTKKPCIELGRSLRDFMGKLDFAVGGGPRGAAPRLREHMLRLFSSTVSATYRRDGEWRSRGFRPVEEAGLFWDPDHSNGPMTWRSEVRLNQQFFEEVTHQPVPIDMNALHVLTKSRSSMAIDIYQWLTHRVSYLREATTIPWVALELQFGGEYGRLRDFRKKFLQQLRVVLDLYPQANIESTEQGLLIRPSKTHVPMRVVRRIRGL